MRLQLQADVELVLEDPGGELAATSMTPWTGENSTAAHAAAQPVLRDDVARVLVVGAILDDELDLVVRREPVQVGPVVPVRLRRCPGT